MPSASNPRTARWAPLLAALLSAALGIELAARWVRPRTWPGVFSSAAGLLLLALLLSALSLWFARKTLRENCENSTPLWHAALPALWCAPLGILLRTGSLWAAIPAMALAAAFCRRAAFSPSPHRWRSLVSGVAVQFGFVAAVVQRPQTAAYLLAAAVGLIVSQRDPSLRRKTHPKTAAAFAALFTVFALVHYLPAILGVTIPTPLGQAPASGRAAEHDPKRPRDAESVDLAHIGVILYPEKQKHVLLIPPLPNYAGPLAPAPKHPLTIPFYGAYWFFRAPDREPPPRSRIAQGTPLDHRLTSTGRRPLEMEARQNLGSLINLSCCSRIEVALHNGDSFPASIALSLSVRNTTLPASLEARLGTAYLRSNPQWNSSGDLPAIPETLSFSIPPKLPIQQFDELRIQFRLAQFRADRNAAIALDGFTLVPKP